MLDLIAKYWWTFVIRGLLAIAFGLIALVWPGITLIVLVFLFGLAGISVANANVNFNGYIWVPLVLVILSAFIITVTIVRLVRLHGAR